MSRKWNLLCVLLRLQDAMCTSSRVVEENLDDTYALYSVLKGSILNGKISADVDVQITPFAEVIVVEERYQPCVPYDEEYSNVFAQIGVWRWPNSKSQLE